MSAADKPGAPEAVPLADCWNVIGVRGDASCDKLATRTHCRNCEVYAGAAQRNLQRPVADGYREHWAEHFRQQRSAAVADDSAALVFRIGSEWLGVAAAMVDAVAPQAASHRLPHRSGAGLLGIVNVGGKLQPSIGLAKLLGIDDGASASASASAGAAGRHTFARLLIMHWEGQSFALPVADLHGIVRYPAARLAAPAATINKGLVRYLTGVLEHAGMHIGVLDATLLGHQMARLLR